MKHWYRTPANGRNTVDYGNTRLGEADRPRFSWVQAIVIAVGFWGGLFLFALVTP